MTPEIDQQDDIPYIPASEVPVTLEKMSEAELQNRLYGGVRIGHSASSGIRGYNQYHIRHNQPFHCVTVKRLKDTLLAWGVEGNRAEKLAREVGYEK